MTRAEMRSFIRGVRGYESSNTETQLLNNYFIYRKKDDYPEKWNQERMARFAQKRKNKREEK